jgi:Zn-dependent protease with chaperone function
MIYIDIHSIPGQFARGLIPPSVVLFFPIVITEWYRQTALRKSGEDRFRIWYGYRSLRRFIVLTTLAVWWALWDLNAGYAAASKQSRFWLSGLALENHQHLRFSVPVITSFFVAQILNYSTDKIVSELHWPQMAIVRRAWWSVVQDVVSMLMVAAGFEAIFAGRLFGIVWIAGAAVIHRVGMVFLRLAEGMRFNRLKSGELRNRSFAIARRMGINLQNVCMVPAGKGHLTNAFGASNMIALTDALPKYLNERQIDSVIAHELIHVKHKHSRTGSLIIAVSFSVFMLLTFKLSNRVMQFRPLVDVAVVYMPMIVFYSFARRAEFQADREAVSFTGDPENAIRALVKLYQSTSVPIRRIRLGEPFQTHPSLTRRISAIAQDGDLSRDRVSKILKETGFLTIAPDALAGMRS